MLAEIVVDAREVLGEIDPKIYGHFIEHLGRCVYGGIWVGACSKTPNRYGLREDVLKVVKELKPPIIRWPGGCFADGYHWEDGVGPRDRRPARFDLAWRKMESNQFGTDEFILFCRELDAEPYICVNFGSGTAEEAAHWVEYCNLKGGSYHASLRALGGSLEPYAVRYWGVGNEVCLEGEIGHKDAEAYAKGVVEYSKLMRRVDPSIKIVAVGWNYNIPDWNPKVLRLAGRYIDYLSIHEYYGYEDHYTIAACPLDLERKLEWAASLIKASIPLVKKDIYIALDEWNVWHKEARVEEGLEQKTTLSDGIFASGVFHVLHRICSWVKIANLAQLVNVLGAIVTNEEGLYVTPIYLAFKMYRNHSGRIAVASKVVGADTYKASEINIEDVGYLDCSATLSKDKETLHLAVINRHKDADLECSVNIIGFTPSKTVKVYELNGPKVESANDFNHPNEVKIKERLFKEGGRQFPYIFPAHSVTIMDFTRS